MECWPKRAGLHGHLKKPWNHRRSPCQVRERWHAGKCVWGQDKWQLNSFMLHKLLGLVFDRGADCAQSRESWRTEPRRVWSANSHPLGTAVWRTILGRVCKVESSFNTNNDVWWVRNDPVAREWGGEWHVWCAFAVPRVAVNISSLELQQL